MNYVAAFCLPGRARRRRRRRGPGADVSSTTPRAPMMPSGRSPGCVEATTSTASPALHRDVRVFASLLSEHLPEIAAHLETVRAEAMTYAPRFLMALFLHMLPGHVVGALVGLRARAACAGPRRRKRLYLSGARPHAPCNRSDGQGRAGRDRRLLRGGAPGRAECAEKLRRRAPCSPKPVWKPRFYGAFVLNRRASSTPSTRDACSMARRCRFLTARPSQDGQRREMTRTRRTG